jgi:hypothetical protein
MQCPSEIAHVVNSAIRTGLLRIRSLAWQGEAERCGVEADHIHNLPDLLADYSEEKLAYYWNVERPSYMGRVPKADLLAWEPLWQRMSDVMDSA